MPKAYEECQKKKGAKIRTITGPDKKWKVPAGKYRHICFLPDGKTYKGYLKTPKKKKQTKKKAAKSKKEKGRWQTTNKVD